MFTETQESLAEYHAALEVLDSIKRTQISVDEMTGLELRRALQGRHSIALAGTFETMIFGKIAHQNSARLLLRVPKYCGTHLECTWHGKSMEVQVERTTYKDQTWVSFKMTGRESV